MGQHGFPFKILVVYLGYSYQHDVHMVTWLWVAMAVHIFAMTSSLLRWVHCPSLELVKGLDHGNLAFAVTPISRCQPVAGCSEDLIWPDAWTG